MRSPSLSKAAPLMASMSRMVATRSACWVSSSPTDDSRPRMYARFPDRNKTDGVTDSVYAPQSGFRG